MDTRNLRLPLLTEVDRGISLSNEMTLIVKFRSACQSGESGLHHMLRLFIIRCGSPVKQSLVRVEGESCQMKRMVRRQKGRLR